MLPVRDATFSTRLDRFAALICFGSAVVLLLAALLELLDYSAAILIAFLHGVGGFSLWPRSRDRDATHTSTKGRMAETFAEYRARVLSYLGDEDPIGVQQATPRLLERRLRGVSHEALTMRPVPDKWSIAEIVAHLADAELAMGWRLRNMLANPGVALTWWDQAQWAERLGYAQQEVSLSLALFRSLREGNLRLLLSVPRARWVECYGVHEVRGRQTVDEFVRLEAAHDLNHMRQIDRILGESVVQS